MIGFFLFIFSSKLYLLYLKHIPYLILPILLVGFFLDLKWLILKLAKTRTWKIIYAILGYFAYIGAEWYSKLVIYEITAQNPELYSTANNILIGIFFLPSWLIIIALVLIILLIISLGISTLTTFIDFLGSMVFRQNMQRSFWILLEKILNKVGFEYRIHKGIDWHIIYFIAGLLVFAMLYPIVIQKSIDTFHPSKRLTSRIVLISSYYPNKSCQNIEDGKYIKLIGNNLVSESNIHINKINDLFTKSLTFSKPKQCN
jgi:F0F1-type ATP synthase membrane subunit c/vacuolar-type H+-ATPase subunit K